MGKVLGQPRCALFCVLAQPVKVRVRSGQPQPGYCFCLSFGAGWGLLLAMPKSKEGLSLEGLSSLLPVQPWATCSLVLGLESPWGFC